MFVGVGSSVTGDTPVLIRSNEGTRLVPIGEFVDTYHKENEEGRMIPIENIQTLGYDTEKTKFRGTKEKGDYNYFGNSSWKNVRGVYRHKVHEIYEIEYLGGMLRMTGDHSIFVRHRNLITSKRVDDLKEGEIIVNLPFKVRSKFIAGIGTTHRVKAHKFTEDTPIPILSVWNEDDEYSSWEGKYAYALGEQTTMSQKAIGENIGVSQATVGLWQRGIHEPHFLNSASHNIRKQLPQSVPATPSLLKLLGYYTAEGRTTDYYMQFVFGLHETQLHKNCIDLMEEVFGSKPHLEETEDNSLRITYHSKALSEFFQQHCGNGSKRKHIPTFLWDLPEEYFLAYLQGYTLGDGYTDKSGRLAASSVSKQLILELVWLSSMHGIQVGFSEGINKEGRIIEQGSKPLPESIYWTIKFGKTSHPFAPTSKYPNQFKKPIIRKITKKPYDGYVYDLCGCDNEAFFGGVKPSLLHNSRVRDLFATAKKAGRSIIFIDELDAIGRQRGSGFGGGHDEREQTLNQILVEMDGFERDATTIIIAATNRPDVLDQALLRPGRFDRRVMLDLPDINDREAILKIHSKGKPLAENTRLREVAERTPGFAGADLENLMNEAAIFTARRNKLHIGQDELLESIDKVLLGPERKSHVFSTKEKEITAFHEAGHALVASLIPHGDPVRKVSIISRGRAGGYTLKLPSKERNLKSKAEFLSDLAVLLGGYVAEKLTFKDTTTGPSNDLEKATEIARSLIMEYGMSEKLGPVTFGSRNEGMFMGGMGGESQNYSEKMAEEIDRETTRLIENARKQAEQILKKNKSTLEKIAKVLIEKETIEREELEKIIGKKQKK
ncbi:MAG: AAA family ATPase [bacterium]|nr:AAA family ATPase [bacterium]